MMRQGVFNCRRRKSARVLLSALFALFAASLLDLSGAFSQPAGGGDFEVPQFQKLSANEALLKLIDLGVAYEFINSELCPPEIRIVVNQIPPAGTKVKKSEAKITLYTQKPTTVPNLASEIPKLNDATPEQVFDRLKSKGFAPQIWEIFKDAEGQCAEGRDYRRFYDGIQPAAGAPVCLGGRIVVRAETRPMRTVIMGRCDRRGVCICF